MIDFLRGMLVHVEHEYVVLDVHGVGYRVFCANPFAWSGKKGGEVILYTHHHVREDAMQLYGFASREEQELFRRLLDVSGIGPRVAVGILSGGRPEAVVAAIRQEDISYLTRLPGIGKKTAQRMILDLKDKLAGLPAGAEAAATAADPRGSVPAAPIRGGESAVWQEAREGLRALGYTEAELDRAWPKVRERAQDGDGVDAWMKLALQELFKG